MVERGQGLEPFRQQGLAALVERGCSNSVQHLRAPEQLWGGYGIGIHFGRLGLELHLYQG